MRRRTFSVEENRFMNVFTLWSGKEEDIHSSWKPRVEISLVRLHQDLSTKLFQLFLTFPDGTGNRYQHVYGSIKSIHVL